MSSVLPALSSSYSSASISLRLLQQVHQPGQGTRSLSAQVSLYQPFRDTTHEAIEMIARILLDAQGNMSVSATGKTAWFGARTDRGDDTIIADVGGARGVDAGGGDDVVAIRAALEGDRVVDMVYGRGGDDTMLISSLGGTDRVSGGKGNDTVAITSQTMIDRTEGGAGDDTLMLASRGGVDRVSGDGGDDTIVVQAGGNAYRTYGDGGDDTISVTAGGNAWAVSGGSGDDSIAISAAGYVSVVRGGDGADDILVAAQNASNIYGEDGDDTIAVAAERAHLVEGGSGDDTIRIKADSIDRVSGGSGDDHIVLDNTSAAVSNVFFAIGDGNDVVETNGPLDLKVFNSEGTAPYRGEPAITHNDDGTLTIGFGARDSVTVKATGDLVGKQLVVEQSGGVLHIRAAAQAGT